MLALLPLISGVVLVALISPVMLGGLVFSGKSLQPKFSKLNPLPGIKRMFSAQTGAELLKAILKTILVGSVTGFFLWHHWPQMMRLMAESPITAMGNAMDLVGPVSYTHLDVYKRQVSALQAINREQRMANTAA